MSLDAIVVNPGRLRILTALAVEQRQEFVHLRQRTQLTDGNLAAHAKRLRSAGLIEIDKQFRDGKPVTSYLLTAEGRKALETHARRLVAAISHRRLPDNSNPPTIVRHTPTYSAPAAPLRVDPPPPPTPPEPLHHEPADDWID